MLLTGTIFSNNVKKLKIKNIKTYQTNVNHSQLGLAILIRIYEILDKLEFKANCIIKDKGGYFMLKREACTQTL